MGLLVLVLGLGWLGRLVLVGVFHGGWVIFIGAGTDFSNSAL